MKILFLIFGYYVTFSLSFGAGLLYGSIMTHSDPVVLQNNLKGMQNDLEKELNKLSLRSTSEPDFPFNLLSDEFLLSNKPLILNIYNQYDRLCSLIFEYYGTHEIIPGVARSFRDPPSLRNFWKRVRGKYKVDQERIEGIGRRISVLDFKDRQHRRGRLVLYDDGMLASLILSKEKFKEVTSRSPQLEAALKKQISEYCILKGPKDEGEFCASCMDGQALNRLKCCGKVYHKKCLEKWWLNLEKNQPFHCPLCRRTPAEIKS